MKEDRAKSLASGANDYVTKPVDTDLLLRLISEYLYAQPEGELPDDPAVAQQRRQ